MLLELREIVFPMIKVFTCNQEGISCIQMFLPMGMFLLFLLLLKLTPQVTRYQAEYVPVVKMVRVYPISP